MKLEGHKDWVSDIKLLMNHKDLIVSCSLDKECRLWSLSRGECLRVYSGHSNQVWTIWVLSEKIFVSFGEEIKFWHVDRDEEITSLKVEKLVYSYVQTEKKSILFGGQWDWLRKIKI